MIDVIDCSSDIEKYAIKYDVLYPRKYNEVC
jgi:hypothetical protein